MHKDRGARFLRAAPATVETPAGNPAGRLRGGCNLPKTLEVRRNLGVLIRIAKWAIHSYVIAPPFLNLESDYFRRFGDAPRGSPRGVSTVGSTDKEDGAIKPFRARVGKARSRTGKTLSRVGQPPPESGKPLPEWGKPFPESGSLSPSREGLSPSGGSVSQLGKASPPFVWGVSPRLRDSDLHAVVVPQPIEVVNHMAGHVVGRAAG